VLDELGARIEEHGAMTCLSTNEEGALVGPRVREGHQQAAERAAAFMQAKWGSPENQWSIGTMGLWSRPEAQHINVGEQITGKLAARLVAMRGNSSDGVWNFAVGDNTASLCALAKGRSSVVAMNVVCRHVCSLRVACAVYMKWLWIRSASNPADFPSRLPAMQSKSNPYREWIPDLARHGDVHPHPGPHRPHGPGYKGPTLNSRGSLQVSGSYGLRLSSVKTSTRVGYLRAILGFTYWYDHHGDEQLPMDQLLDDYVFWCYDSRMVSRQQVVNLLSGLNYVVPTWASRGVLEAARKSLAGWAKITPTRSHLPIPRNICLAVAVELVRAGLWPVAAAILLGFDCYLRHSELMNLRVQDVALPGDPRLQLGDSAHVVLRFTKAGKPQQVKVRDPLVLAFLVRLVAGRAPRDFLFGELKSQLMNHFQRAQRTLGFPVALFVLHSLRHGGASFDHMNKQPINDTIMRGRWSGLKITKTYIQESQARTLLLDVPPAVRRRMAIYLSSPDVLRAWLGL